MRCCHKNIINRTENISFANGYFYSNTLDDNKYGLTKIDIEGNVVATVAEDKAHVTGFTPMCDGDAALFHYLNGSSSGWKWMYVNSDFSEVVDLPVIKAERDHGITEDVTDYSLVGANGNTIYVKYQGKLYSVDKTDLGAGWKEVRDLIDDEEFRYGSLCGDYFISNRYEDFSIVIDVKSGETIATYSTSGLYSPGMMTHCYLKDDHWYKVQSTTNSGVDYDKFTPLGEEKGKGEKIVVDDTYYVYKDEYGMFLRTYEKGKDSEETIYLYDN